MATLDFPATTPKSLIRIAIRTGKILSRETVALTPEKKKREHNLIQAEYFFSKNRYGEAFRYFLYADPQSLPKERKEKIARLIHRGLLTGKKPELLIPFEQHCIFFRGLTAIQPRTKTIFKPMLCRSKTTLQFNTTE